ncbi:hypothetical protein Tsubulata_020665 [Turnera subulata]|uniref:Legume lectin domain-containing protein n=1 Tax=Turnera subulata TaxID=218843 RepID=A0A9Q0G758_9ROSI|nr:hypothetical protein Tsubulata_020665 [Turnera subulata]
MAPPSKLILFLALTALLSLSATARPCKTLLISSYSFSIDPRHNPNHLPSSGFLTVVAEIRPRYPSFVRLRPSDPQFAARRAELLPLPFGFQRLPEVVEEEQRPALPLGLPFYDTTSLRDRAKDILSVVFALLFGVGCGALTAAAMYLLWSLVSTGNEYRYGFEGEADEEDADDVYSPKKMGYVKIPAADPVPEPVKNAV